MIFLLGVGIGFWTGWFAAIAWESYLDALYAPKPLAGNTRFGEDSAAWGEPVSVYDTKAIWPKEQPRWRKDLGP